MQTVHQDEGSAQQQEETNEHSIVTMIALSQTANGRSRLMTKAMGLQRNLADLLSPPPANDDTVFTVELVRGNEGFGLVVDHYRKVLPPSLHPSLHPSQRHHVITPLPTPPRAYTPSLRRPLPQGRDHRVRAARRRRRQGRPHQGGRRDPGAAARPRPIPLLTLVHPLLFSQVNSFFCVLALFESVAQTVVEYTHEASFFPEWVTEPVTRLAAIVTATWRKTRGGELAVPADESIRAQFANQSSVAGVVCRRLNGGRGESLSSRLEQLGEMADKLRQGTYAGDTGRSPPPIAGGVRRGRGVASPRTCLPLAPAAARWSWVASRPRLARSLRWLPIPTPAPDMP